MTRRVWANSGESRAGDRELSRATLWQATFIALAGLCVGAAIPLVSEFASGWIPWTLGVIVLGALAGSAEIRIRPHGILNLSPIVFLVVTVVYGLSQGVVVAVLAPMLAGVVAARGAASRRDLGAWLAAGGEAAISLLAGAGLLALLGSGKGRWIELVLLSLLTLGFMVLLQILRIGVSEGIPGRRLVGPVLRGCAVHVFAFIVGSLIVWGVFRLVGHLGIVLATIVIVELYYPWKLLGEQRELFLKSLQMISNAVDLKDPYTAHHSRRVSSYAVRVARLLDVPEEEVERIRIGALMHDIGKIGVPGSIIRKPARLTDEEMAVMMQHVDSGRAIVEKLDILNLSADIVQSHHENFDGTGYPAGLRGKDIPLGARIVFVADAFDALTTDRPYRRGRSPGEAIAILEANAGTQFDPDVVSALKKTLR